jgi:hypothetical protein
MNFTAIAFSIITLSVGEAPLAKGYQALKTRSVKLDLDVDPAQRAKVSHVDLFASQDQGGVSQAKPDQAFITFTATDDGLYWLNLAIVYRDGKQEPANIASQPPAQKLLIDTTPPAVRIRDAVRLGDDVSVEWSIDDAYPADERSRVEFRPQGSSETSWKTVPITSADKRGTRFNPQSNLPIQIRVTVEDQAGNSTAQTSDVGGVKTTVPSTSTTATALPADTSMALKNTSNPIAPPMLPTMQPIDGSTTGVMPSGPAPIMDLTAKPPVPVSSVPVAAVPVATVPAAPAPLATSVPMAPAVDRQPAATVINFAKFDLPYQLEAGPSGISRVELYITRDDGQTWAKWSEHDGKESPLKVALDRKYNPQLEGTYGLRLVPVSGAGLTDGPPAKGTAPEIRVQIDLTPPMIKIFQPEADARERDVLMLKWEATDKNFAADPITLEWSEGPSGPWKSVAGLDGLVPVAAGQGNGAVRVANTGSYGWKLPASLPTHKVYLKVTAIDAAGNKSEVATPAPILVDLVKPRARIQGIMPTAALKP